MKIIRFSLILFRINKKSNKIYRQMQKMLNVRLITDIIFEENDGSEIPFTDLFEFRASIGVGGFGFVVAVLDKSSGEEIALKIL